MTAKQTTLNRINKDLSKRIPVYGNDIPLDEIFEILKSHDCMAVDEAGESWSGLLCGETGTTGIEVKHESHKNITLRLTWYKMESGRWELTVYVN